MKQVAEHYANDFSFNIKVAFVIYTLGSYGILISEDEPELKAAVDPAVQDMIDYETLDEILTRWLA